MNIQAITPNYYSNPYNKTAHDKRADVTFQANYTKLLEGITTSASNPKSAKTGFVTTVLEKVKATINCSKKSVQEFVEDAYDRILKLVEENKQLGAKNESLQEELRGVKAEYHGFQQGARAQYTSYQNKIEELTQKNQKLSADILTAENERDAAVAAKDVAEKAQKVAEEEARAAQAEADKYAPIYKIKPAMDGLITPEQGIKLFEEIVEKEPIAQENLMNFMLRGEGKEGVLAQLERYRDLANISEAESPNYLLGNRTVDRALEKSNIWKIPNMNLKPTFMDLLQRTIKGNAEIKDILSTPGFRKQAAQNLAAIAKPNNAIPETHLEKWSRRSNKNVKLSIEEYLELSIEEFVSGSSDCWNRV